MTISDHNQRNKRIAKNTILLYCRTLVSVAVSLYTARIVINTLGVEDYGLHHLVGGLVAMLAFLPGSMASATQRFFAHAIGQKDQEKLNRIFGNNIIIYLIIALVALAVLATLGQWFVANRLNIPAARVDAVQTVFLISSVGFAISILQSPFMAIIVAHEDMKIYAYMSIFDALVKLGVVYLIGVIAGDKIVIFSILLFCVTILNVVIYQAICFRRYDECRLRHIRWDGSLAKELVGFTWWTVFGQLTTMARTAAVTILLNQYFTPAVIAARAIATNIGSQSNTLASQFNTSLYPPIIKAYAAEKRDEMYQLVINGSKITFFLMWILALPLYTGMDVILQLWLGTVPEYAVSFARLTLIEGMIFAVSLPMTTAARAPGKMAAYELILGTLQFSILFASWFILHKGGEPNSVFYTAITVNLIMFFVRLVIVSRLTGLVAMTFSPSMRGRSIQLSGDSGW
jgi:O-antigen/teichoic acid export membrane protein